MYGKPGSGKSVLSSQIIYFLRSDPTRRVAFFYYDFSTPAIGVTTHILKSICSQLIRMSPELASFVYHEHLSKGSKVVPSTLKVILQQLLSHFEDLRLVIDSVDETPQEEHKTLIKTICELTDSSPSCKTLIISQDIASIAFPLSKKQKLSLQAINEKYYGAIKYIIKDLKTQILEKAEGYFYRMIWEARLSSFTAQSHNFSSSMAKSHLSTLQNPKAYLLLLMSPN
ncbi:hypothetical protein F5Y16DRAFT_39541 [Xylariaceae sp. FL0255]|nr:hypothetical protein F5Y16DRAFT_39541 [Xylariaceae sp. FL0255]